MKKTCGILIPIYQLPLSNDDLAFFKNITAHLGSYPISVVCPEQLRDEILEAVKHFGISKSVTFPRIHFSSLYHYSRLLCDEMFYKAFDNYDYVLIAQPDTWFFHSDLSTFLESGCDYLGAPLNLSLFTEKPAIRMLPLWYRLKIKSGIGLRSTFVVGNGGLSLRNVKAHLRVIEAHREAIDSFFREMTDKGFELNVPLMNEDCFWSFMPKKLGENFVVGSVDLARRFAFESQPEYLYSKNSSKLPLGCHAWQKHDPKFWQPFIGGS